MTNEQMHERVFDDLAVYMLGELDPVLAAEFRKHIDSCAFCQRELQQLQADAALYALSATGPAPPQRARQRFLNAITSEERHESRISAPRRWLWIPTLAAVVFAVLAAVLFVSNRTLKRTLANYVHQNQQMQADLTERQELLADFGSRDAVHMTLSSAKAAEPPHGRVVYVPKRGAVLFAADHFAPAPPGKAYQLWLVPMKGKPVPCGTFRPDPTGSASFVMAYMTPDIPAKTFAITMEPEGGSQTPTMPILMSAEGS
jgi:anti-sigma-K factor RskA